MTGISRRSLSIGVLAAAAFTRSSAAAERILIRDLYARGAEFSPQALALADRTVSIPGFMAPPLKPDAAFFVLTKLPMSVCPFCDSELTWPTDIVLVRLGEPQDWVDFNQRILVSGTLTLGTEVDQSTGFVSRVRLVDASYELV